MTRLSAIGLLLAAATAAPAQVPAPTPAQAFVPWANKFLQKDSPPAVFVHDFGTVPKGTLLVHKMTITNIYDVPVQVIDVRKSCSCLEAAPPMQILQPHETAELVLTMNSEKFVGPNAQSFFITFGPQFVSTAVIQVKANSRGDVTLKPGQANFGVVSQGAKPTQVVTVKYQGKQRDWQITGFVPPAGPFDVQIEPRGGDFRVIVSLKPDAPAGAANEPITLKTNDPAAPLLTLNASAVVQGALSVSPGKVRFEDVPVGESATQKVVVRAGKSFRIQPVADGDDGVSIDTLPAAAPVQIVTVKFTPKAAGAVNKTVMLYTDLGTTTITIDATGK